MNSITSLRKRRKTGRMTRIVLLISFIILIGRLLFVLPGAFQHHQDKKANNGVPMTTQPVNKE
ncbi:YfgG family protein [Pantoea alhagi]|uniref:YfgG family protein n=1 Tax=Pantoea alhagi TaxID=1891675 RepID=UPI00202B17C8|nr:YfgG family protein [Pantoea alhagi]URQ59931.1 YfgG family protein [Pantoea alhagi]